MKTTPNRTGPFAVALLLLLLIFTMELVISSMAHAKPYPRHDHHGLSEDKRQYPNRRFDDYEDYYNRKFDRRDNYIMYNRPSLSKLDPTPEGTISLERVKTTRSQYTDNLRPDEDKEYGKGHYDQRDNKGIDVIEGGTGYY